VIEDSKVKNVTVDGEPVDESRHYNVVTVDYLAEGNDHMGRSATRSAAYTRESRLEM